MAELFRVDGTILKLHSYKPPTWTFSLGDSEQNILKHTGGRGM